jgi:hypothetical protein
VRRTNDLRLKNGPVIMMMALLRAINWKHSPLAQVLAILLMGSGLGLLWILNDLTLNRGMVGSIVFFIIALPVYVAATLAWNKVVEPDRDEPSGGIVLSWKRVGVGLYVALGIILAAGGFYVLVKSL